MRFAQALVVAVSLTLAGAGAARAEQWRVVEIKVEDNAKTDRNTVMSISGIDEGDTVTDRGLEAARERLLESGLFSEAKLRTELTAKGVRLVISAKDRISWFVAPTFSYSKSSWGGGVAFGETNLFGRQKKLLLYAGLSNTTGSVVLAYVDPALAGSWFYYQIDGHFQRDQIYEYDPMDVSNPSLLRTNVLQTVGGSLTLGVRWWRKFRTEAKLVVRDASYDEAKYHEDGFADVLGTGYVDTMRAMQTVAPFGASTDGLNTSIRGLAGWDGRASIHGVQNGMALLGSYEAGFGDFEYWKVSVGFHAALRFFKEHNLILRASGLTGRDMPFFEEFEAGGTGFRGYLTRQFRGDTRLFGSGEYVFPIVKIGGLHIRGLVFYDSNVSTYMQKPTCRTDGASVDGQACTHTVEGSEVTYPAAEIRSGDGHVRYFLPGQPFSFKRESWNNGVGGGLRFYLKSIAMPLVGVDYGYGIEGRQNAIYVSVGMVN
jgi:outer membrane protein insertion porin family